jgi:hypothetical protein
MSRRICAVYTAQKRIPATDPPIPVESAFGGMALYRVSTIGTCRHSAPGDDCEHVAFHQCLRDHDGRLFIHPGVARRRTIWPPTLGWRAMCRSVKGVGQQRRSIIISGAPLACVEYG